MAEIPTHAEHENDLYIVSHFDDVQRLKTDPALITSLGLVAASTMQRIVEPLGVSDLRGHLPNIIDVPSHLANTADTLVLASIAAITTDTVLASKSKNTLHEYKGTQFEAMKDKSELDKRRFQIMSAVAATAVIVNLLGESSALNNRSIYTADKTDIAYGLIGGILAYRALRPVALSKVDTKNLLQNIQMLKATPAAHEPNAKASVNSVLKQNKLYHRRKRQR